MIFKREDVAKIPDVIYTHKAAIEEIICNQDQDAFTFAGVLKIGKHLNALGMLAEGLRHEFAAEIVKKNLEETEREQMGLPIIPDLSGETAGAPGEVPTGTEEPLIPVDDGKRDSKKDCPLCHGCRYVNTVKDGNLLCGNCLGTGSIPA